MEEYEWKNIEEHPYKDRPDSEMDWFPTPLPILLSAPAAAAQSPHHLLLGIVSLLLQFEFKRKKNCIHYSSVRYSWYAEGSVFDPNTPIQMIQMNVYYY